ncbi:ZrgA family zinc uptake protein [Aquabacterium sp.]|uniref:ZrgA family zinc uptake protein n=1 Tax=Aquabacterium sp. TaxID=1872578 RepID=UPI002B9F54F5|nr:DUF2796 domain-containing protein [Aquabacterium sp.]HSW05940.1 DUF2796 domain-containing protein [Aquabacterium sp.]
MRRWQLGPGWLGAVLLMAPLAGQAQQSAHVHGAVRLDVAVDAASVSLQLEAPLDSLLGFERAPRSDAERRAVEALRVQLAQAAALFAVDAGAGCVAQAPVIKSALLDGAAKAGEHADLEASYLLRCRQPGVLKVIDLNGLMTAFSRIQRVEVQVATPGGQLKQTLKRPQAMVRLTR